MMTGPAAETVVEPPGSEATGSEAAGSEAEVEKGEADGEEFG